MKLRTVFLAATLCMVTPPAWGQYYENPYTDPYLNPYAPQARQRSGQDIANEVLRGVLPSYEQQRLEEQRRQNSGRNSWMNMCNAMGGNAAARALCYEAGR